MKKILMLALLLFSSLCLFLVSGFLLVRASILSGRMPDTLHVFQKDATDTEDSSSQIPIETATKSDAISFNKDDPMALYYLYDFLYIGDSFIERLAKSGILHESSTVLAKSGTSAKDWYLEDGNDRYVDFLAQLQAMEGTPFKGIILNYGINNIKSAKNITYMKDLIQDIHEVFPDVPLFVMKIMPVAEQFVLMRNGEVAWDSTEVNHGKEKCVDAYNTALERFCRTQKNTHFIDATDGFIDENGNMKVEYADERGLHIADPYIPDWCRNIFEAVTAQ